MQKTIVILLGVIVALLVGILIVVAFHRDQPEATPKQLFAEKLFDQITSSEVPLATTFEESKIRATRAQLSAFEAEIDIFQLDLGVYPSTQQGLASLHVTPPDLPDKSKWKGPYARKDIPPDPWGNQYSYELLSPTQYRVYSAGPDGVPNTADDVVFVGSQ